MNEEAQAERGWSDLFNRVFNDLGLRFSVADGLSLVVSRSTPSEISDRNPASAGFDLIPTGGVALGPVLAGLSIIPAGDLLAAIGAAAGQPGTGEAASAGPAQASLSRGPGSGNFAPGSLGLVMLSPDDGGPGLILDLAKLEIVPDGTRYFDPSNGDVVVLAGPLVGHDRGRGGGLLFGLTGDDVRASAGADVFAYTDAAESSGAAFDFLFGFDPGADRIDLPVDVSGFAAALHAGTLSAGSFDDDLAAALGDGLRAGQAVLFAPDSGDLAGTIFLIVDGNNEEGYQPGEDFVFALPNANLADLSAHTGFFV